MSGTLNNSALRIAGFGACMISGYPHATGSMFELACGLVEERLSRPVESAIVALGGFPAPRAAKYLKNKVLGFGPDYVVIQFASTDAQCQIRRRNHPAPRSSITQGSPASSYHSQPSTAFSALRWEIASMIGYLRKIDPTTPLEPYLAAMEQMVNECRAAGATPVVLSPFVYGSRYTMRKAFAYRDALRELSRVQDTIFVDCLDALAAVVKSSILQHDGFHLSLRGHQIVGEAIARAIILDACSREVISAPAPENLQS